MGVFSWFSRKKKSPYVLMLFLAEHVIYAYAFNEKGSQHSQLHHESADPHLNNLVDVSDHLIERCEKDIGEGVYLQKTVFALHSHFITDAQTPKEDTREAIKKLCKELDLENLGYITSVELAGQFYGSGKDSWVYAEETLYGFTYYLMQEKTMKLEEKIQRGSSRDAALTELRSRASTSEMVLWAFEPVTDTQALDPVVFVSTDDIPVMLQQTYMSQQNQPAADEAVPLTEEKILSTSLPDAPGFGEAPSVEAFQEIEEAPQSQRKLVLPPKRWLIVGAVGGVVLLLILYVFFIHSATVSLATKKENFAASVPLNDQSALQTYSGTFSVQVDRDTTGEKVIGEKSKGTATFYNRTFEPKTIQAGTKLTTPNGISFTVDENVTIASASGVPVQDGNKSGSVTATAVGPEGNISKNAKLIATNIAESDVYAVASKDFDGGFKRTVIVFSQEDQDVMEEQGEAKAKEAARQSFIKQKGSSYAILPDTLTVESPSKKFSSDVGEETKNVTYDYSGNYEVKYVENSALQKLVKKEQLKGKEFVKNTFRVERIVKKGDAYQAQIIGKVQNSLNEGLLKEQIAFATSSKAKEILGTTSSIDSADIVTRPLPLPFLPRQGKITITYDSL